jgi:hypothetical protein
MSGSITFCLISLCLGIFHKQDTNEEIQQEERPNQNEHQEEVGIQGASLLFGALVDVYRVDGRKHDVRPALERRDDEQSHHGLENIVEV